MAGISEKTLIDLEFTTVLETVSDHCMTNLGRAACTKIRPIGTQKKLIKALQQVHEYSASFSSENRFPGHYFDDIQQELKLLQIENSHLEPPAFLKVLHNTVLIFKLKTYLKKFKDHYPTLFEVGSEIAYQPVIAEKIKAVITSFGEVDEKASVLLKEIRREIQSVRSLITASFTRALGKYKGLGYLDDIQESVIDHQRVLAVQAMNRRKVKGSLLGSSKTGSIVFIAPEATLKHSRELQNLLYDEQQEVIRILRALSEQLREYIPAMESYQAYLTGLDVIAAKAKYAHQIQACLPEITDRKQVYFKDAFHPILLAKNTEQRLETVPQTIHLHDDQRIIVISGPNAGGKSITLKTVGLLQVMLQSGLLIPVHERSSTYFFDKVLTDIGDNQSIENQLSTYSYRLKNMRAFLKQCNERSLFLIDEFGTGSDPELGGALAEIFLEEFYQKKAFGIITTHYANLKVLANELPQITNANMQFDERSLQPLFKLFIGQAGSSFTFEVAQKNGIPFQLINRAKKRVAAEKVRLDKTISRLQKERSKLQKTTESLEKETNRALEQSETLTEKEANIREKLTSFQQLYDHNQKMLSYGRKINELLHKYFQTNNKKELLADFNKWLTTEKTKHLKKSPEKPSTKAAKKKEKQVKQAAKKRLEKTEEQVLNAVKKVRKENKAAALKIARQKANYVFKVDDTVRIIDSQACGSITKIEKQHAFINYGIFTTKTALQKLELVKAANKSRKKLR